MTNNRKFKMLGAAWLVLGGFTFAIVPIPSLFSLVRGNTPSPFEAGDEWPIVVLVFAVAGAICMVNGLALLRRNRVARPLLIVSSLLLLPSAGLIVPLLVVLPSLWLTLSTGGKEALESYLAREIG